MMVEKENVKDHSLPDYYGVIYIAYIDVGGLRGTFRVDHKETWWRIRSGVAHGDVGPARFELAIATAPGWYPTCLDKVCFKDHYEGVENPARNRVQTL